MNLIVERDRRSYGPYPLQVVSQFLASGRLLPHDLARLDSDPSPAVQKLEDILLQCAPNLQSSLQTDAVSSTIDTFRALGTRLLFPWNEIARADWLKDRRLINLAVAGMSPAIALAAMPTEAAGYWLIALYFSLLWAFFFYYVFRTPQVEAKYAILSFTFTAFVGIFGLLQLQQLPLWQSLYQLPDSKQFAVRLMGYIGVVGIHEELCKAAILFWLVKRPGKLLLPQTVVFYGMLSGLGFGIYEGVMYQRKVNIQLDTSLAYFSNIARLTSLPFFHSIWSGLAGYFVGCAALYPKKRYGLWILGIAIPSVSHGIYDTFGWNWMGLGTVFLSVLLLTLYLKNSGAIQRQLSCT